MRHIVINGNSRIKNTSASEAVGTLAHGAAAEDREVLELDTTAFHNDVESGNFEPLGSFIAEFGAEVRSKANASSPTTVHYVGLDEVPTLIALGAYVGDELVLNAPNYDRTTGRFGWPQHEQTVGFDATPLRANAMSGEVAVRVEVTSPIDEADVDHYVPVATRLANVSVRPTAGDPRVGLLQSEGDLKNLRETFRDLLAAINSSFPNATTIHLFVAAPVPGCLAIGQELRLRNNPPFQTYRYRSASTPRTIRAIALSGLDAIRSDCPLTDEEKAQAAASRGLWKAALAELQTYSARKRDIEHTNPSRVFPEYLDSRLVAGYSRVDSIPPIWEVVGDCDRIDDRPAPGQFAFDQGRRLWSIDDRLLLSMHAVGGGDSDKERRLARAFLWHEYLHFYQGVSRYTALDIGSFANSVERLDYVADLYGVLHQADFHIEDASTIGIHDLLVRVLEELLHSFWAFEDSPPIARWQQRRLRRYLNWYWQKECVSRSKGHWGGILCLQPTIEVSGPPLRIAGGRRIELDLTALPYSAPPEIALVTSRERLFREGASTTLPIGEMILAFAHNKQDDISHFFSALYEKVHRYSEDK